MNESFQNFFMIYDEIRMIKMIANIRQKKTTFDDYRIRYEFHSDDCTSSEIIQEKREPLQM